MSFFFINIVISYINAVTKLWPSSSNISSSTCGSSSNFSGSLGSCVFYHCSNRRQETVQNCDLKDFGTLSRGWSSSEVLPYHHRRRHHHHHHHYQHRHHHRGVVRTYMKNPEADRLTLAWYADLTSCSQLMLTSPLLWACLSSRSRKVLHASWKWTSTQSSSVSVLWVSCC